MGDITTPKSESSNHVAERTCKSWASVRMDESGGPITTSRKDEFRVGLLSWNVYERENIGVAYTAAGRLAISSGRKILDVAVETDHGGEYLIRGVVSDEDFEDVSEMPADEFEGFRIVWIPVSRHFGTEP